jgi:NADPH:quinone reductase-like Zn-dependent oxidoreductase
MRRKLRSPISMARKEDLQSLKGLVEAGKVTPAISRTYPLAEIPEAIRHLEEEHARGKAVVTV